MYTAANTPGDRKLHPWDERITWFWYGDREVFHTNPEALDARARKLAEQGVTIAILAGTTHVRMSFYPYWNQIRACIRAIADACHRHGIRLVEHHSASLWFDTTTPEGWQVFQNLIFQPGNDAGYDSWKKILPYLACGPAIDGIPLIRFSQIDGRTGRPPQNYYNCNAACFNNPEYRKIYFQYVSDICQDGIDGIMNDDVQYFGGACACEHCRRLFEEQTGYSLPEPGRWEGFYENYGDPVFIAWKRFRLQSAAQFYQDLTKLYADKGLALFRPNYCSELLLNNETAYPLEPCAGIWDNIFQENCFGAIIKQSHLAFMAEAVHRYALAKRRGKPSMSMFYPQRANDVYFSWALARSWGQMYTGTFDGMDLTPLEKPYRLFEEAHADFYRDPDKISDLAFYFSQSTRDCTAHAQEAYMRPFVGALQAAYVSGYSVDMVFEEDTEQELSKHRAIFAPHVAMMSDRQLTRLRQYVLEGGQLIAAGKFAVYDGQGRTRRWNAIERLLGLDRVQLIDMQEGGALCYRLGTGRIWLTEQAVGTDEFQPQVWSSSRLDRPPQVPGVPSKWEKQKAGTGALLRCILGKPAIVVHGDSQRVIASAFRTRAGLAVHLINLADTICESQEQVGYEDEIPNFSQRAEELAALRLELQLDIAPGAKKATLYTPERKGALDLGIAEQAERRILSIPKGSFAGYALITLE